MAFASIKSLLARHSLATPQQFEDWSKAWRKAADSGSQDSLLAFIARERGVAEDVFLQELAKALNWSFIDLPKTDVSQDARRSHLNQGRIPIHRSADQVRKRPASCRRQQSV